MSQEQTTKVVTSKVRFSYCNVWEAKAMKDGGDKKFSTAILIKKTDKALLSQIKAAIEEAKRQGKDRNWAGTIPKNLKLPLRDGDEERPDDENYAGCYFINCSSKTAPGIIDRDRNKILDPTEFYSGCYGRVSINFYPFNANGNKGVAAGLQNLQKLTDGEPLSGKVSAEEDFSQPIDDEDNILDFMK